MPLTSKICSNIDSDIDLLSSTRYMMSDKTDVDEPIQVCFNNQSSLSLGRTIILTTNLSIATD